MERSTGRILTCVKPCTYCSGSVCAGWRLCFGSSSPPVRLYSPLTPLPNTDLMAAYPDMARCLLQAARDAAAGECNPHLCRKADQYIFTYPLPAQRNPPTLPHNVYWNDVFDEVATSILTHSPHPPTMRYFLKPTPKPHPAPVEDDDPLPNSPPDWMTLVDEDDAKHLLQYGKLPFGASLQLHTPRLPRSQPPADIREMVLLKDVPGAVEAFNQAVADLQNFLPNHHLTPITPSLYTFRFGGYHCFIALTESGHSLDTAPLIPHRATFHLSTRLERHGGPCRTPSPPGDLPPPRPVDGPEGFADALYDACLSYLGHREHALIQLADVQPGFHFSHPAYPGRLPLEIRFVRHPSIAPPLRDFTRGIHRPGIQYIPVSGMGGVPQSPAPPIAHVIAAACNAIRRGSHWHCPLVRQVSTHGWLFVYSGYWCSILLRESRHDHDMCDRIPPCGGRLEICESPTRHGQTITNIYGDGNWVTSEQGANGWSTNANVNLADGSISSTPVQRPLSQNPDGPKGPGKKGRMLEAAPPGVNPRPSNTHLDDSVVETLSSGNVTLDTTSTAPVTAPLNWPAEPLDPPDADSFVPGPSVDRFWHVTTLVWDPSQKPGSMLEGEHAFSPAHTPYTDVRNITKGNTFTHPHSLIAANEHSPVADAFANFMLWRSGLAVHVSTSASPAMAGALLVTASPEGYADASGRSWNVQASGLTTTPYVLLNLCQSNSATLILPPCTVTPFDDARTHTSWAIRIYVFTQLNIPPGISNRLPVQLMFAPLKTRYLFAVPYKHHLRTRTLPGSGDGYSFNIPENQGVPMAQYLPEHESADYIPGRFDNFMRFASTPGLIRTLRWGSELSSGAPLMQLNLNAISLGPDTHTPLAYVLSSFAQQRGSLSFDLVFSGTQMHSGRLLVSITPPTEFPPPNVEDALRGHSLTWDITVSCNCSFHVPFFSPSAWRSLAVDGTATKALYNSWGWFSIFVYTPLMTTPFSCDYADIHVFARSGPEFVTRIPSGLAASIQVQGDQVEPASASPDDGINALEQVQPSGPPSMEIAPYFNMFTKAWLKPLSEPDADTHASSEIVAYLTEELTLPHAVLLSPSVWLRSVHNRGTSSLLTQALMSCFYFRADLDIELMFTIPATDFTATVHYPAICVQYHPPGSTIIQPQESASSTVFNVPSASVYATAFPRLPAPKGALGSASAVTYHMNLSIPYSAINPMVPTVYSGSVVSLEQPTSAPYASPDLLGRLYIFFMRDADTAPKSLMGDLRLRLRNFTPAVARLPLLALAYKDAQGSGGTATPPDLQPPSDLTADLPPTNPLEPAPLPTRHGGLPQGGTHGRCYIIRKSSLGFQTWALRSSNQQIGIQFKHLRCVIGYEECEGTLYQEVLPAHFAIAQSMIGQPYPYHLGNTSAHWIERITNIQLPRIPPLLACCIGAGALASLAAQTVQRPERHGLKDLAEASQNFQRAADAIDCAVNAANLPGCAQQISQAVTALANTAGDLNTTMRVASDVVRREGRDIADDFSRGARSMVHATENATKVAESLNLPVTADTLLQAAQAIKDASSQVSQSIDTAAEVARRLIPAVEGVVAGARNERPSMLSGLFKAFSRLLGYGLIIFGNPSPISIAGVLILLIGDLGEEIVEFFRNIHRPIACLFAWMARKLGLTVSKEECLEASESLEIPQPQGPVRDYNDCMNALKNTDWLLHRILDLARVLCEWLTKRTKEDPAAKLDELHQLVTQLYSDSVDVLTAPRVLRSAVEENLSRARAALPTASELRSPPHTTMLLRAITNYETKVASLGHNQPHQRPEPYVVYIHGPPGCGKSLMGSLLASRLAQALSGDPDDVYSPASVSCEYYDGYRGQTVHYIDDVGQDPEGKDWRDFAQLVSTAPFVLPMANLEEKGRLYTSRVIIMTSNFPEPNPRSSRCPEALSRRLRLRLSVSPPPRGPKHLDVAAALAPSASGPTKYFSADCPFLRFESFVLRSEMGAPNFTHMDELLDYILSQLNDTERNTTAFRHLLPTTPKKQGRAYERHLEELRTTELEPERHGVPERTTSMPCLLTSTDGETLQHADSAPHPAFLRPRACRTYDVFHEPCPDPFCTDWPRPTPERPLHAPVKRSVVEESPLTEAIERNKPLSFVEKIWQYRKPIFLTSAFLSAVSAISTIAFFIKSLISKPQAAYTGKPPIRKQKKDPEPQQPLPPPAPVRHCLSLGAMTVAKNVVQITGLDVESGAPCKVNGTALFDRWVLTVSHVVPDTASVVVSHEGQDYKPSKVIYDGEICALYVPGIPQFKDLRRFTRNIRQHSTGVLPSHTPSGPAFILVSNIRLRNSPWPTLTGKRDVYYYTGATFPGLCGAPLILQNPGGPSLVALHQSGVAGTSGYAIPIADLMAQLEVPKSQSEILECEPGGPSPHVPRRSRLVKSPAYGAFPVTKEPAVLSKYDRRTEADVDVVAFSKQGGGDIDEPWPSLIPAVKLYFSKCNFSKLRTLTMLEAINGTPLLDGIDMSQSPGYPWCLDRNRRSLFNVGEDGLYHPCPELYQEIEACLHNPDYFYTTFLKDELRGLDKVAAAKTRLIEAAPIHAIIAGRMLFGGLFETMHSQPGNYGSAVGCDPDYHWTPFYHNFLDYSEVWALDYSNFDSTIPSVIFKLIGEELAKIIELPPSIPPDSVQKYVQSIYLSKHVFGERWYTMKGGNPSGCVGTSILNSMVNNISLLSAMLTHPDFDPHAYRILCYGDDVIYASVPSIHPRHIADFYHKHTLFKVTPADKGNTFPETSSIHDVTFLKRHFVPDERFPTYIHPVISPETYQQSVMWTRGGPFQDVITSLCYLAHHAGPNNYQDWCDTVRAQCLKNGFEPTFIPYEVLQYRWLAMVMT
uniref:Genome polyprotein n=1 Tax=Sicinivirus sp. TaxID=1930506 RepID=A0A2P1IPD5_9PICO|nr:polyprotein [Sicinivirus sp.]